MIYDILIRHMAPTYHSSSIKSQYCLNLALLTFVNFAVA